MDSSVTVKNAGQKPFLNVGKPLNSDSKSIPNILADSGLNWEVIKVPIETTVSHPSSQSANIINPSLSNLLLPKHEAVVRTDNYSPIGVVGIGYNLIQNEQYLEASGLEILLQEEKISPLRGGAFYTESGIRAWIVFKMSEEFNVGPVDHIESYIIFNWSHDGLHPMSALIMNYNSHRRIYIPTEKNAITIRHTKNAMGRVKQANKLIQAAIDSQEVAQRTFQTFVNTIFTQENMEEYLERLFPKKEVLKRNGEPRVRPADKSREEIIDIFKDIKEVSYTKWAALNSVIEFVDHKRTQKKSRIGLGEEEARLNSIWFGNGAGLKVKAMKELE